MVAKQSYLPTMPTMGRPPRQSRRQGGQRRPSVVTFGDAIVAHGGMPLLRQADQRVIRCNPAYIAVTITDNAAVNASLKQGASWDLRTGGLYTTAAADLEAVLHLEALGLYINDSDYRGETQALKEQLDNLAYIRTTRDGMTQDFPLRGAINEPWGSFDFKQTTAANEERALHKGGLFTLERPIRLDLKVDTFSFRVDTAINFASGNILAYVIAIGSLAPREMPGAGGIKDTQCSDGPYLEDIGGAPTALGPLSYADFQVAVASRSMATQSARVIGPRL